MSDFTCSICAKSFKKKHHLQQHCRDTKHIDGDDGSLDNLDEPDPDMEPDWGGECQNCGQTPIVPLTGMCGPCTFGEADTVGGNW